MAALDQLNFRELLDSIAARTPSPGGGAVACITGALSAALAQMVVNYSIGKKSLSQCEQVNSAALVQLSDLSQTATRLADEDALAYGRMNELWKLDKDDDRRRDLPAAVLAAIQPPRNMALAALEILRLLQNLVSTTNPQLRSDLAIAAILALAAAQAAAWNVRINFPALNNPSRQDDLDSELESWLAEAEQLADLIDRKCRAE